MESEEDRKKIANRIRYSGKPNMMISQLAEEPRNDWYMMLKQGPRKEPTDAKD